MAGRGRVKVGTQILDQMQATDCISKDVPQVSSVPPPIYPQLLGKPVVVKSTETQNYQIMWKWKFLNYFRESPYYLLGDFVSDADQDGEKKNFEFNYQRLPIELQLNSGVRMKRKIDDKLKLVFQEKIVEEKLKRLEEKENNEISSDNEDNKDVNDNNDDNSEKDYDEEAASDEMQDEEMDEENDYAVNYFDNGEAYIEEDDNFDDGPIY